MTQRVVGIFGGTFDPFHLAHLRMAQAFVQEARLSELRIIPAGEPYHRSQRCTATAGHRLAMARLGVASEPAMRVDDREVRRQVPSYTIETLEEVRAEIGAATPLWFLIGTDSLMHLSQWKRWTELFRLANIAVALRPGFREEDLPAEISEQWHLRQQPAPPKQAASGTILRLTLPPLDLSASAIRAGLVGNADISHLVPPAIAAYIREHGLYR